MPYVNFGKYILGNTPDEVGERKEKEMLSKSYGNQVLGSQTLDQFYYYSAKDTGPRDRDQVVTKFIDKGLELGCTKDRREHNFEILRVDQLWL